MNPVPPISRTRTSPILPLSPPVRAAESLFGPPRIEGGAVQEARAVFVDVKRVRAPEIRRPPRRRVDDELAGRRVDDRVQRAARERELMTAVARLDQAQARIRIEVDVADRADVHARLR